MKDIKISVNVDNYLAVNKYDPDEESHIVLAEDIDRAEFEKLVLVCPAALYKLDEEGNPRFDHAGCLECGTCRIACGDTIVEEWRNPAPGAGVRYRFG